MAAAPTGAIARALLSVLCHGHATYTSGYVGWGSPGLFSMLNSVADEVLTRSYRGERPADVQRFYASTRLIGYGNASLGELFRPFRCAPIEATPADVDASVALLLAAPRYAVASRVVHLLYQPLTPPRLPPQRPRRYAVAVHLRRGDKLTEERNSERIEMCARVLERTHDHSWPRTTTHLSAHRGAQLRAH